MFRSLANSQSYHQYIRPGFASNVFITRCFDADPAEYDDISLATLVILRPIKSIPPPPDFPVAPVPEKDGKLCVRVVTCVEKRGKEHKMRWPRLGRG